MVGDAYVINDGDDPPGVAVIDTACNRAVHGRKWRERAEESLQEKGLSMIMLPKTGRFTGVGGGT